MNWGVEEWAHTIEEVSIASVGSARRGLDTSLAFTDIGGREILTDTVTVENDVSFQPREGLEEREANSPSSKWWNFILTDHGILTPRLASTSNSESPQAPATF